MGSQSISSTENPTEGAYPNSQFATPIFIFFEKTCNHIGCFVSGF